MPLKCLSCRHRPFLYSQLKVEAGDHLPLTWVLYSLPWALTLVLSQLPQEAERVEISISHFSDGEANCLQSPQSQGALEQGCASPFPAQGISHHIAQSLSNGRA